MKLSLFGATGHIGHRVLEGAVAAGHEVTAFVRDAEKLGSPKGVHVIVGEFDDANAVKSALAGADAVIVALAAGNGTLAAFDAVALPFLERHGPHRIVSLVGAAVRMPGDPPAASLTIMTGLMRLIPNGLLRDAEGHAARLAASGLDWTLVRAANFGNAQRRVDARPAYAMKLGERVSRDGLAQFMLDAATHGGHEHEAPMLVNAG